MWSYQRSIFDDLINEKKTKMAKGWNYKHLGNFLPVLLHCMLTFCCQVLQNIKRRYLIDTSLTSSHWQLTHFRCSKSLPREGWGWVYHILHQIYEFPGSFIGWSVLFSLFVLFVIVALKQLFMNIREVVYLHLNVNIRFKIVNKSLLPAKIRSYWEFLNFAQSTSPAPGAPGR